MNAKILKLCQGLEAKIQAAYEEGTTIPEAEKLAAEFLHAEMLLAQALQGASLDARMRKSGLKAIRAAVYLEEAGKTEKKPSDSFLGAKVDVNELVSNEQRAFDEAETEAEMIQNYLSVVRNGHIYFRGIAKGSFGG